MKLHDFGSNLLCRSKPSAFCNELMTASATSQKWLPRLNLVGTSRGATGPFQPDQLKTPVGTPPPDLILNRLGPEKGYDRAEYLLMQLFLKRRAVFLLDLQEVNRPLGTKSVKRPIKVGKRPINPTVLVGISVGCLMGYFRAPPPWRKAAPLKRPIKRSMMIGPSRVRIRPRSGPNQVWGVVSRKGRDRRGGSCRNGSVAPRKSSLD